MTISWTLTQKQRLRELGAASHLMEMSFPDLAERDKMFQTENKDLVFKAKTHLKRLQNQNYQPEIKLLEFKLAETITRMGFTRVSTPILLARGLLEKMTITRDHPLNNQVYWASDKKCLRPMLAPNLYYMLKQLARLWEKPIRIFEIGPCFRKESEGAEHLSEFTMLNLVELGLPENDRQERLKQLASIVMDCTGIEEYELTTAESDVYGDTIDINAGLEVGSGAIGPHKLDRYWGIVDTWVGIGFGLERLILARDGGNNIHKVGRSLSYLDGIRLNI